MTAGTLQDLGGEYLTYSKTSGTDEVITVEHKWKDLNNDGVRDAGEIVLYDSGQVPPENFTKGYPVEIITVTGQSAGARSAIQAEVTRLRVNFKTLGALYTDKACTVSGSSVFCGYNHDINTTIGTTLNACYAFHETEGHLSGVATTGDVVQQKGANKTDGVPVTNTSNTNVWYTLPEVLGLTAGETSELLANADYTSIQSVMDGITYVQGNAKINATDTGHGLLYVTGDCTINGGFKYWGLIYIEGDCKIVGTPWILGTVLVKGTSDFQFNSGNAGILFSEEAVSQYLGAYMPMVTLAWRDL
jgi:hypothetical protein